MNNEEENTKENLSESKSNKKKLKAFDTFLEYAITISLALVMAYCFLSALE